MKQGDVEKESANWDKIKIYIDNLLADERSTLGDINKSSLTFQVDGAGNTLSVTGGGTDFDNQGRIAKQEDKQYVRWNKLTDSRIKLKNVNYSFSMFQLSLITFMVLLPIIIFHIYEYAANVNDSERLVNSIRLVSLTSEMWNMNNLLKQALITTILFNNTRPILGKPSADAYAELSFSFRNSIMPDLLNMREQVLPKDFEEFYVNMTSQYKVCDLLKTYGSGSAKCGDNSLTSQDINYLMFLRSLLSITDDVYETWKALRRHANVTTELMTTPKLKNFIGITHNYSIVRDLYYTIQSPLSQSLYTLLDTSMANEGGGRTGQQDQNQRWQYYVIFVIPMTFITSAAFYYFVYTRLTVVVHSFWHTAFLIPMNLIKKNALLDKFFKTLAGRAKTKISFF